MALAKRIPTNDGTGVHAEYWKITEISSNWIDETATLSLSGYFSQESRLLNLKPVVVKRYTVTSHLFQQYFSFVSMQSNGHDIIRRAYEYIKGHQNEFYGSLDV